MAVISVFQTKLDARQSLTAAHPDIFLASCLLLLIGIVASIESVK